MGDFISQNPSPLLRGGRSFYKDGEGERTKRSMEGVAKLSMYKQAQSIQIRQVIAQCATSWFSHPSLMSSSLHGILVPLLKAANLLEVGCLKVGI